MKSATFLALVLLASCKTPGQQQGSQVLNAPRINGNEVTQGGAVIKNNCKDGGHEGPTTGTGWPFNPKEGCYLECKNVTALKKDFLAQLRAHRVYGDFATIEAQDPEAGRLARFFAKKQTDRGIKLTRFDKLTTRDLYDGSKWQTAKLQPGDILLNMNFGQPNHSGIFYSKRGLAHARLVVRVTPTEIITFDGGWQQFSRLQEVNAQAVWLRPRKEFLKQGDLDNLVKWAGVMQESPYDNTLVDDWREYREYLHKFVDSGMSNVEARDKAMSIAKENKFAPYGDESPNGPDSFAPPSGIYCSEGTAGIYSYLGFRQFGETAVDMITTFSEDGNLPQWELYEDALSGFGADSDRSVYMMHKLFYAYFQIFDAARKMGAIEIPGAANAQSMNFAQALEANLKAVYADDFGASDHLDKQLDKFQGALEQAGNQAEMLANVKEVRANLKETATGLGQKMGQNLNISQAVYTMFYANKAYGPHTFFENGKYFELKGVFYNPIRKLPDGRVDHGNQALYIADWWVQTFGKPKLSANVQTTLYRLKKSPKPTDPEVCTIEEKAPVIPTN